ncbi:MAG: hypothetical protein ACKPCI_09985 [Dolichospermum sp.]
MSSRNSLNASPVAKVTKTTKAVVTNESQSPPVLLFASGGMILALIAVIVYCKILLQQSQKKLDFEKFRTRELDKKLKLALETIRKLENNPDLVDSRHFNLDYLRMRMSEDVFHLALINQMKIKIKDKISPALRPSQSSEGAVGVASSSGKQIDETFDIEYETGVAPKIVKRVLFRVQIRLIKLPIQATSVTVSQIIDCIETYLSSRKDADTWQPTIHGRIVYMHWDQKAKPTPLLVLEQLNEGVNVTFKTTRKAPVVTRY